jgi:competence protein ComEA
MDLKKLLYGFNLILLGFFIGGIILLINSPPKGNPITLIPAPTPLPMKVFISGSVQNPGMYELKKDSRLSDLIDMAGGLHDGAAADYNLAAKLYDGQHIVIAAAGELTRHSINVETEKININEADIETLSTLPGIGPSKAADIIAYREQNGFFEKIEDILNVPGIGEATFAQLKDLIAINQIQ